MDRFINDSYLWYITYDGPKPASETDLDIDRIYVVSVYRKNHGLKLAGIARRNLKQLGGDRIENEEVRRRANAAFSSHLKFMSIHGWAEVSDKLEVWCNRTLRDKFIVNPQYLIENEILKNIEIDPYEEMHYFRELRKSGPLIHKIVYGTPKV